MATALTKGQIVDGYRYNGGDPNDPASWDVESALKPGAIIDDYRYLGGNPNDKKSWQPVKAEEQTRTPFAVANDLVITGANAAAGGVGAIADFIVPGNRVSNAIDSFIRRGEESQSDPTKARRAAYQAQLQGAEGLSEEAAIAARYALENPLQTAAMAAGSFAVPGGVIKGAKAVSGAAGLGAKATGRVAMGAGSATGAAMAGGDAAGQAYDLVMNIPPDVLAQNEDYQALIAQGMDDAQAREALATSAARTASVVPAAIGGLSGLMGVERLLAGGKGFRGGMINRALKTGAVEAIPEGLEEGATGYSGRAAAAALDPSINPMKGVGAEAVQGAVVGFVPGAAIGALDASRQRQIAGEQQLKAAPDAGTAASAANAMSGSLDELTSSVDAYLSRTPAAPLSGAGLTPDGNIPAPAQVADTSIPALRARADREAGLLAEAAAAGTDFERRMALEQLQAGRTETGPRVADAYADLTPMDERQAGLRLGVMRDEVANAGGNALALAVVPHPSQAGRFAIGKQSLPSLDLGPAVTPDVTPAAAQNRIETAALTGQVAARRAEDAPRQVVIDRALRNVEERGGVASPAEARIFQEAGLGMPYDRIDTNLAPALTTDQTLTQATGIALAPTPRESGSESQRVAAIEQANAESMSEQAARNAANRAQAERETLQQIQQTSQPAAAPDANEVIAALQTPGMQRSAEQVSTIRQAQSRYSASDFSILERAAGGTFQLNTPERMRLTSLTSGAAAQTQQPAGEPVAPATPPLMGSRVAERLGLPSGGRIVNATGAKFSGQRAPVPGSKQTVRDGDTDHEFTVVDAGKLGGTGRLLQQIARIFGKRLVVFQSATLQADGFVMDDDSRSIYINRNSQFSPLAVFFHELTHLLKRDNPQAYAALEAVVKRNLAEGAESYREGADLEEITSDLVGNRALMDADFLGQVFEEIAAQNPEGARGIILRMAAAINKAINAFKAAIKQSGFSDTEALVTDLDAVRAAVKQALTTYAQSQREPAMRMEAERASAEQQVDLTAGSRAEPAAATFARQRDQQSEGRVGQVDTHVLNAVRGERAKADRTKVGADEKAVIRQAAAKMKMPIAEVEQMVRDHKAAHPANAGWAQLTLTGAKVDEDTGKGELQYQVIPYSFNVGSNGNALQTGTPEYNGKVANIAQAMMREVRAVYDRAVGGDQAAKNIIAQSGWYKEMRTRLRQEFGGLGDLFADLLGATSPNTPVRTNWDNSVEALRLATTGAFDRLMPRWVEYFDNLDQAETQFRAVFDEMRAKGMTKAQIKQSPEFKEQQELVRAARNFPDELLPVKSNGKKFGFNGYNVARAMVDLWRVVKNADPDIGRGGTAPKAINFSGNLIGFRARATIDVWAARMLQRLAGGLRIPSMAEGGVSGEALESGRNTLQFGFGQDVFGDAVKLIRNDPVLSQDPVLSRINDDDLQALVWFIEKEVWTKGNWTSAAGEGGSFEFEADLAGVSDRDRVNELRKIADSSVSSTAEQRTQADADIGRLMGEMAALPEIARANATLEANAQRMAADKAAPKGQKLSKLEKEAIRRENEAAQAAKKKAKTGKAYKALESQLNKAKAVLKKPTTEQRQEMRAGALRDLGKIARPVDRFTVGLSIQKGAEQGMEPTPPSDAQMAALAQRVADSVIAGDPGATVIGLKAIATEGRYGAPERALDLEAIVRDNFDARPLARTTFEAAQEADQDAAFVARVLRPNELFDPSMHRPGVEIYFRDMNQAVEAARMMAEIAGMRVAKATEFGPGYFEIGGYTVIVDGRPTAAAARGEMGKPVGMRVLYMPEFEARYGMDARLENATQAELTAIIEERADTLGDFADAVLRQFDGVSFAGRFNYEVETRFAGEYQGAIDGYSNRATDEGAGAGQSQAWRGRSIRESIAAATGRPAVDGSEQGAELPGGDRASSQGRLSARRDVLARDPRLEQAAQGLKEGTVTREQYEELVNALKPVTPYTEVPKPATDADMRRGLTSDKVERIGAPTRELKVGDPVGLRLDIPAYANHGVWVVSVHEQVPGYNAGKSIGYESVAAVTNPTFGVVETAALNIAGGKPKATIAVMKGDWKPITEKQATATAKMAMKSGNWVQVGMDPTRHAYFYDRASMEPVVSADEAVQIGPLVLAKNPVYGKKSDFKFSKQRRLFTDVEPVTNDADQLLAPNGQVSNLTEDQWYQVRSPEFKAWFGDWENDPANASQVVDENGEPRVVYHGTTRGGFTVFNEPGGRQRGDIAIFTTDNRDMADSYVKVNRRGGDLQFSGQFTVEDLEARGLFFDWSEDAGTWAVINAENSDIVDEADTIDEILRGEALQEYLANNGMRKMAGIYPVFVNLRDALNVDAEGSNWNALPDGRSTDDVGREANLLGLDGAIITNVVDDGGGVSSYAGEPSTIYMAFDPNAIKSANSNVGTFSQTNDDIRFSKRRQVDTPQFKAWFGPSVVKNANGKPLLVYRGMTEPMDGDALRPSEYGTLGPGIYFTSQPVAASNFATGKRYEGAEEKMQGNVIPAYLRIEQPFDDEFFVGNKGWQEWAASIVRQGQKPDSEFWAANTRWMTGPIREQMKTLTALHDKLMAGTATLRDVLFVGDNAAESPWGREILKAIKDHGGFDGIILKDSPKGFDEYVVFDSRQVKSAIGNNGDYDPSNPDIRASRRRNIFGQQVLSTWTNVPDTKMDDFLYTMQDKQIDTKRVVEAIKQAAGGIDDKWNAYLQEELYHGRTAKQTADFLNDELRPLLQEMQMRGVTMEQFEEYLHNRHAEERNDQIAKVNPNMPDGGSGIDTADARNYLRNLSPREQADFQALARRVDAISANTRQLLVASGLETQDTIDAWEQTYGSYVPLFREDTDFSAGGGTGTGQGYSVRGAASRRATGSSRPVVDILANLAMQRERTIVRAQKTRVAQAVYGMAVQNPNTDFWLAIDPEGQKDPAKAIADLVSMGINPIDARNIVEEPVQQTVDPRTGLVVQRVNPLLRNSDNVLAVRIDGRERYVFFNNNDERAQRMVGALKNLDADQLGRVMGMAATVTRYFASINTQYNPIFGAINFMRDVQGATLNLTTTPIADKKAQVLADSMMALRGIYSDLRSRRKGSGPATGTWATLWEEFQREGGQTGFRDQFSKSAERAEALEKELKRITEGKAKQAGRAIFDWLSDYNETMENAVRLAAYKAAKEKGLSNQQAASVAKNLTVNFNRKGQVATQAGALYAFFNASVQGTTRLAETLRGPAGKKIMAGGLILGAAQAMLLAAAGFDEDEPPEFVKERNLVIPTGDGKYLTIPMPLGFNVIPNTSRVLTEWAMSGWRDPSKRIGQITGAFLEMFNPIGNAGWSVQTIAPTIADPLVALAENRDWTGKPIAKKDRSDLAPTPGYTRAKETASWFGKELAYYLNLASGGTKYKPGMISPTPDQIDYLIGQITGGVGREAMKVEQTVTSSITGEELPTYKVPILGRFYGDTKSGAAESERFYNNLKRINEHEAEIKGRQKNRDGGVADYRRENPEARLVNLANQVERDVQELRRRRRDLVEKNADPTRVKMIEERIKMRMKSFNDRVRTLREQEPVSP